MRIWLMKMQKKWGKMGTFELKLQKIGTFFKKPQKMTEIDRET